MIFPFPSVDLGITVISVLQNINVAQHWGRRGAHLSENKGVRSECKKCRENLRQMASVSTISDEDCRFNCVITFNKTAQLGSSVVSHHPYSGVELNSNLKLELTYTNNH